MISNSCPADSLPLKDEVTVPNGPLTVGGVGISRVSVCYELSSKWSFYVAKLLPNAFVFFTRTQTVLCTPFLPSFRFL